MKIRISTLLLMTLCLFQGLSISAQADSLRIVSQNLNRFFDDHKNGHHRHKENVLSSKKYRKRLQLLATKVATEFEFAQVIAFQEIENKAILEDLARLLKKRFNKPYQAVLKEGNDVSGLDVGFLVSHTIHIESFKALFKKHVFPKKDAKLFSRPPLALKVCTSACVTIVNVHLRSMRGLNSAKSRGKVSLKRRQQAETLARWIDRFQTGDADEYLMVLGDFNAISPSDEYVDVIGAIMGEPDQHRPKWKSRDLVKKNLIDLSLRAPSESRYSYIYKKKKQLIDYLLISSNLENTLKTISYGRIDYKFSDHGALKAEFFLP